jgi:hypothetical protein
MILPLLKGLVAIIPPFQQLFFHQFDIGNITPIKFILGHTLCRYFSFIKYLSTSNTQLSSKRAISTERGAMPAASITTCPVTCSLYTSQIYCAFSTKISCYSRLGVLNLSRSLKF